MRVVHLETGDVLASELEIADSFLEKMRGLRFRRSLPEDHALVFPFESVTRCDVDMLFVPFPLDVLWLVDGEVRRVSTLRSWIGFGIAKADTLIELPAGTASGVEEGDGIDLEG